MGRRSVGVRADFMDADAPPLLYAAAESVLGPIDILVNNASSARRDTFRVDGTDAVGRAAAGLVDADNFERQFFVNARAGGLLMAEYGRSLSVAVRRGVGSSASPAAVRWDSPGEASYGAAKAALENYTMTASHRAGGLRSHRQRCVPAGDRHGVGYRHRAAAGGRVR